MSTVTPDQAERSELVATERGGSVALVKSALLLHGITVNAATNDWLRANAHCVPYAPNRYRVELQLGATRVLAPLVPQRNLHSEGIHLFRTSKRQWELSGREVQLTVTLPPAPRFYAVRTSSGRTVGAFGHMYGSVLVLGGTQACGYGISEGACRFCRVGSRGENERTFGITPHEAAEAVRAAAAERPLRYVFLPAASFDAEDGGVREIEPLVKAVRRHCSAFVLAALHPPRHMRWIDHAYAIGVDGISFNLEVHDVALLERFLPGRARYLGRSRYLQVLRHAGRIFPRGAVWSEVIVGILPASEEIRFLYELMSDNVVPFLVPFRGHHAVRPLSVSDRSFLADVELLLQELRRHLVQASLRLCWLPEWPHLLGAADGAQDARLGAPLASPGNGGWQAFLRELALRNVARLRRSLRVRELGEHDADTSV